MTEQIEKLKELLGEAEEIELEDFEIEVGELELNLTNNQDE
ncbi:MAG: hypothetical protein U9Q22_08090 [Candidatus Altiarchaeota archaeon]|nr:hypothetical protein [Candidatus Altiarchaeota archaeon]